MLDLNAAIPLGRSPPVGYGESPSMHPRPPRAPSERLGTVCSVRTVGILVAECLHAALHCPLHCPEELLVVPGWGMQLLSRTLLPISCILRKIPIQLGCLRGVCQVGIAVRAVALACREVAVWFSRHQTRPLNQRHLCSEEVNVGTIRNVRWESPPRGKKSKKVKSSVGNHSKKTEKSSERVSPKRSCA